MHKRLVNHCTIELSLKPNGPILIKSGREGADPTKPDMEFVETFHQGQRSIYLPGSSLKGAIRAHAERIVRTVGGDKRPTNSETLWASDPLKLEDYKYLDDIHKGDEVYKLSSFTDQLFGSTAIASRFRVEDAHPTNPQDVKTEERNGVAIDRVFGSTVPGALFNFQVCTAGEFKTKIHLKNFSLAQLGLIALVLRDLDEGWFGLGFAKSRGLGLVNVHYEKAVVYYPGCLLKEEGEKTKIQLIGSAKEPWPRNTLLGAGEFLKPEENLYNFPQPDQQATAIAAQPMDLGFGVQMVWEKEHIKENLFTYAVEAWKKLLPGVAA